MNYDLEPLLITLKLALIAVPPALVLALLVALPLAFRNFPGKSVVLSLIHLPRVLPPSALGLYLLILFSPHSILGELFYSLTGSTLTFSFSGLVLASFISIFPSLINPMKNALEKIPEVQLSTAKLMGKSPLELFMHIIIPQIKNAILAALASGIAQVSGAFGVILMVGGNIPGETKVMSIAIYESFERGDYGTAHFYALILVIFSFLTLWIINRLEKTDESRKEGLA